MFNTLGGQRHLGYCTNVHAANTYAQTVENLHQHATAVKAKVSPDAPMGLGLWLSASAARQIIEQQRLDELRDWLAAQGLYVFTLNGFPYGDFHSPTVKHRVYQPNWCEDQRLRYTKDLITILAHLRPDDSTGSISSLPLGWHSAFQSPAAKQNAAMRLTDLVHWLARIELDTGRLIHLDLEPEPGCALDTSADVVDFFKQYLLGTSDERSVRAYLRVCHDVCHAAVMGEAQNDVLAQYRAEGIGVGKVQLSSALAVPFSAMDATARAEAWDQLKQFNEPRYLHQTTVQQADGRVTFFDDLPEAMNHTDPASGPVGTWRIHFHMPLFLAGFGQLNTTQQAVLDCLDAIEPEDGIEHFETETYAWGVLPPALQPPNLATGLADELQWVSQHAKHKEDG
jgi:hypothetical protein